MQRTLTILAMLCCWWPAHAAFVDASVSPRPQDRLISADYRLYIPEGIKTVRAIIVRQHGCGTGATVYGLTHAHDPQWQALAARHDCALLATRLVPKGPCSDWCDPDGGSDYSLLQALSALARKSGHPEIEQAPWVLCGHSGGAAWTAKMLVKFPDRILAAVSGRMTIRSNIIEAVTNIPVLYALGAKDNIILRREQSYPPFAQPTGGLWAYAVEPTSGHELGNLRLMAIPWIDRLLTLRLPARSGKLRPLDPRSGWYGDNETHHIAPAAKIIGDKRRASWLPDETLARRWQEYVKTGTIQSKKAPVSPTALTMQRLSPTTVELHWQHAPDLDSELAHFRIYRDGHSIGSLPPPKRGHGDAPEPVFHGWFFRDTNVDPNKKPSYRVTAFRGESESAKSREAKPLLGSGQAPPPLSDLVVVSLAPEPARPKPGEACTFSAIIKNVGVLPTSPDTLIGVTFSVGGRVGWGDTNVVLLPGESVTVRCAGVPTERVWTAKAGKQVAAVVLDDVDRIPESNEQNNRFTTEFEVPSEPAQPSK